ncbi:unnamed protein product [Mesocestoides corti]|uniref:G_PROTEIN_RECEP_F1_2 domain-containing protein n=1 Tax=Mesocestoides corti TaxID=53468 RepID=A0A0R3U249_MESCO|nr:unnamed protein product [Mesocestoides corti]
MLATSALEVDSFNNTTSRPESINISPDASENVLKILLMGVSCLGLITNSMIVIVLSQLRGSHPVGGGERSARVNLLGLAIADFCICLSTLPLIYSKRTYKRNDFMLYYTLFGPGLVSVFLTVSAWMVVLVSILRYLAVFWPLKSRFYLRCKSVFHVILSIYLVAFIFNLPLFLRYNYEEIAPFGEEALASDGAKIVLIVDRMYPYSEVLKDIYNIVHIICTNVGPFIVVLVTNISVIVACKRSENIRENFGREELKLAGRPISTSVSTPHKQPLESSQSQQPSNTVPSLVITRKRKVPHRHSLRPRAFHRVTPLLLAVIFAFLLLSTPFGIVQFVCLKLIDKIADQINENRQLVKQYLTLNRLLEWTNFLQVFGCAVNFFLYFVVSRTFRQTTRRTLRRIKERLRRRRGFYHSCAYMCSVCCCDCKRSRKNDAYIVRVCHPVECRRHQQRPFLTNPCDPMRLYLGRNQLQRCPDEQTKNRTSSNEPANRMGKGSERLELKSIEDEN